MDNSNFKLRFITQQENSTAFQSQVLRDFETSWQVTETDPTSCPD